MQATAVGVEHLEFEHTVALLIGIPPADFSLKPVERNCTVPIEPPALPSALLERNPTVAAVASDETALNIPQGLLTAGVDLIEALRADGIPKNCPYVNRPFIRRAQDNSPTVKWALNGLHRDFP